MSADMIPLISKALGETVYMVAVSMLIATIIGIPLGVLLHTTNKNQILECLVLNKVLGAINHCHDLTIIQNRDRRQDTFNLFVDPGKAFSRASDVLFQRLIGYEIDVTHAK